MTRPVAAIFSACVLALSGGADVWADVIGAAGRPPVVDAKVEQLRDGQLVYRLADREYTRPLEQVEYLQITGWQLFNLAEKQVRDGHTRQAINVYENVLKELQDPKQQAAAARAGVSAQLDRELLTRARLIRACDREGRFDRAVEIYLQVIDGPGGTAHLGLQPQRVPAAGSSFLATARIALEAAIRRHNADAIGTALSKWLDTWPAAGGQVRTTTTAEADEQTSVPELQRVQALVQAKKYDDALAALEAVRKEAGGALQADLYYWRGRAHLGRGLGLTDEAARTELRRAGLAFMRVVIHYPGYPRAAESLFLAGGVCRRLEEKAQATGLWMELIGRYPQTAWAEQARKELSTVTTSAPAAGDAATEDAIKKDRS